MGWLPEIEDEEDERTLLKRVVSAFYLLAWIAGLSCLMPQRGRDYILGWLRRIEANAIEIVSNRAYDRGLEFLRPDHQIADALAGGGGRAEAMRLARSFRLLASVLDHLIEHYPCRRTGGGGTGLFAMGNAPPFAIGASHPGNLLAKLCQKVAGMTGQQLRAVPMRLAVEPIDSS